MLVATRNKSVPYQWVYMKLLSHMPFHVSGNIDPTVAGGSNLAVEASSNKGAIRTAFGKKGIVDVFRSVPFSRDTFNWGWPNLNLLKSQQESGGVTQL
jgi:hypothetical protein